MAVKNSAASILTRLPNIGKYALYKELGLWTSSLGRSEVQRWKVEYK